MTRVLLRTSGFVRAAKRMAKRNPQTTEAIRQALLLLESDAFDPRLRTHKLKGSLTGCWACSAAYDLRIVFEFVQHSEREAILLLSVGTHEEVY